MEQFPGEPGEFFKQYLIEHAKAMNGVLVMLAQQNVLLEEIADSLASSRRKGEMVQQSRRRGHPAPQPGMPPAEAATALFGWLLRGR